MLNVSSSSVSSAIRLLNSEEEEIIGLVDRGLIRINFAWKLSNLSDKKFETFQNEVIKKLEEHALAIVTGDVEKIEKKIEKINEKEKHSVADKRKLKKLAEEKTEVEESLEGLIKDLNNIQDYTKFAKSTYEEIITADSKYAVILRLLFSGGKLIVNYSTVKQDKESVKKQIIKEFDNKDDAVAFATEMNNQNNSEMNEILKGAREQIQAILEGLEVVAA